MCQLVLASGSPRRKQLLEQVGIPFIVDVAGIDESQVVESNPKQLVEKLAKIKGEAIPVKEGQVILSADTVVSYNDDILTKPSNKEEALRMLSSLSGKKHWVYSGVMIRSIDKECLFSLGTSVRFWDIPEPELKSYINSGDWKDKAGGYGIQSSGAFLVKEICGDYYNVMGLPISTVVKQLREFSIYPSFPEV
ncbi:Maf family protein [Aquibacillus saliphilus]|uniref:Maf family protein n=1 Tax=Aquibacillus saliphilus TaxID=1909422 RepID=UPI001CF09D31